MATNPNNAVGTNAAYSGRTSPNALNDALGIFSGRGVLSGWDCLPDSGMDVKIGGDGSHRDVAIAEDNSGNKITVNNISQAPISVTIPAAPASNSRIDAIVAYVENPPMGTSTDTDNPGTVGLIVVSGTVASSPVVPSDNTIRTAITSDGAAGSTAYYVTLATVLVQSGTTTITGSNITDGDSATISNSSIAENSISNTKLSSPKVIASGTKVFGTVIAGDNDAVVQIGTTLADTSYQVQLTTYDTAGDDWGSVRGIIYAKTTSSFTIRLYKQPGGGTVDGYNVDWVVIK